MKLNKLIAVIGLTLGVLSQANPTTYTADDLHGVWKLTQFVTVNADGSQKEFCPGVFGTITYMPTGFMTVSLNCRAVEAGTQAEAMKGILFYSGPFEVDTARGEVIHRARNFSHESLNRVQRRKVEMSDANHLRLSGELGAGRVVLLDWVRQEKFSYSDDPITGVFDLVGSENEVNGRTDVPFCNGFNGTIMYTPGGHAAVSINCGKKLDPNVSEPADQFGRQYFYSGHFTVADGKVFLTPDNASEQSQIGKPVNRVMILQDDLLILDGVNGSKFRAVWKKRGSFVGLSR